MYLLKIILRTALSTVLFLGFLFLMAFGFYFHTQEKSPVSHMSVHTNKNIAVVALRDNVSSFEKFGTSIFTLPYLEKYYDEVCYLTQAYRGDKKEAFKECLSHLLDQYAAVDIFLLAHSNSFYEWVGEIDPEKRKKIRLVYNTGCGDSGQSPQWLSFGVKAYVAHEGAQSISPIFYVHFLPRWGENFSLEEAVHEANKMIVKTPGFKKEMLEKSTAIIAGESALKISDK